MSKLGRTLKVGDKAITDHDSFTELNSHKLTLVTITKRVENSGSQSGVCFCVSPALKKCRPETLIDADWFEPMLSSQANDLVRMRTRIESLRGLCKTAVGMLRDAGRDEDAEQVHALIGDMEWPL